MIRKYFFGASLKTSFEMIEQLAVKAKQEQDALIEENKKLKEKKQNFF